MDMRTALERFLATDSEDAGCGQTWALIDMYVEVVAAGGDPERMFPGISEHLATCGPCAEDYRGLLNAVIAEPPALPIGSTGN